MIKFKLFLLWIVCQVEVTIVGLITLWSIFRNQPKAMNIFLGYDRLGNAAANDPTVETISKRAALARNAGKTWGKLMCRFLNLFQQDHCDKYL
jgi:hypothetical protein